MFSDTTSDYGCTHSSASGVLSEITPFGEWALQLLSTNTDISQLKQVEIYFIGSGIKIRDALPYYPDLEFAKYGMADISLACLPRSSQHRKKRSLPYNLKGN